jgi:hypothetical protein
MVALLAATVLAGCPGTTQPKLTVSPAAIDFGTIGSERTITIQNGSTTAVQWNVSVAYVDVTYQMPVQVEPWLSVDVVTGETATEVDHITLTADRTGLAPSIYRALVTVASTDGTQVEETRVSMRVEGDAAVSVDTAGLAFACPATAQTFTIANPGEGPLEWSVYLADPTTGAQISLPTYLTVSPRNGVIAAGSEATVTVNVDCEALGDSTAEYALVVVTSAGNVAIDLFVGGTGTGASIGVEPPVLDFGRDSNELTFDVYNTGPSGSILNFQVTSDRPDLLFLSPVSGTSVGRITDLDDSTIVIDSLDRQPITVLIDRSAMESTHETATITITAPGAEPVEVTVRIEASGLRVEGAMNRARPPYVVRFVFLLRDAFNQVIPTQTAADLDKLRFEVREDGIPLDLSETNMFLDGPEKLQYNIVLLLDFTGSMETSGVIDQMLTAAKAFVAQKPESFRVALMEVHDRQQSTRLIRNFDTSSENLIAALEEFELPIAQRGASDVYDGMNEAVERLEQADEGKLPFDDADVRALVVVSDGRDTSSVNEVGDLIDFASEEEGRTRIYPIGFGENVNSADLLKLAVETGGHYYAAPTSQRLASVLGTADGPGTLWEDLNNQVVLTYLTLFQIDDHKYSVHVTYEPTTGETATGYFERDGLYYIGDTHAGQVSLHTTGIQQAPDQTPGAEVFLRADYVPRDVTRMRFRLFLDPYHELPTAARTALFAAPYSVTLAEDGPLVHPTTPALTWRLAEEPEAALPGGDNATFTVLTDANNYLDYGEYGDLLKITFTDLGAFATEMANAGLAPAFEVGVRVDNRIYYNPPTQVYFHFPGGLLNPQGVLTVDTLGTASAAPAETVEGLALTFVNPDFPNVWNQDVDENEGGYDDFDDREPDNAAIH